ncbi:MAG: C-GCAxxG-C-C family protein [Candidatus Methanoplasma sp.]|jgi:C_GCAxxG_C_C family probable redox protein|nr:C-GCAxxG-C-C family protein [Candidatus Methanoplasma sp.]
MSKIEHPADIMMAKVEKMNDKVRKAAEYFGSGLYCSQAVLGAFCEDLGMDRETAFRVSCGLNSGVRCADICGAVTGAVLVISLKHGGSQSICNAMTEEFLACFKEKHGSVICRDILGCDISTPEGKAKAVDEGLFKNVCTDAVITAAQILSDKGY